MSTVLDPARPCVRARFVDEAGVRLGLAHGVLVLVTVAVVALDLEHGVALALVGLVALAGGYEAGARGALLLGTSCWAFWTGFVEHREAQLSLGLDDLVRLAVLVAIAVAAALVARAVKVRTS